MSNKLRYTGEETRTRRRFLENTSEYTFLVDQNFAEIAKKPYVISRFLAKILSAILGSPCNLFFHRIIITNVELFFENNVQKKAFLYRR